MTRTALATHTALVYGGDGPVRGSVGAYLGEGVARDERVMAVVPQAKLDRLRDELGTDAQRVEFVDARDGYRPAVERLPGGARLARPGARATLRVVAEQDLAVRSPAEVRDYQRLEAMVNVVFRDHPLTLLCPYDAHSLSDGALRHQPADALGRDGRARDADPTSSSRDPAAVLLGLAHRDSRSCAGGGPALRRTRRHLRGTEVRPRPRDPGRSRRGHDRRPGARGRRRSSPTPSPTGSRRAVCTCTTPGPPGSATCTTAVTGPGRPVGRLRLPRPCRPTTATGCGSPASSPSRSTLAWMRPAPVRAAAHATPPR